MIAGRTIRIVGGNGWLGRWIGGSMLKFGFINPRSLIASSCASGFEDWSDVQVTSDNLYLAERSDVIILSVRPKQVPAVEIDARGKLVSSVMAGVSVRTLRARTGSNRLIRAMPHAAAEIGKSYTPWHATEDVSSADKAFVQALFETCVTADELPHVADIDYLTGLAGSRPALPGLLANAMLSDALSKGLPKNIARRAVQGVVGGASQLIAASGVSPIGCQ